MRVSKKTKKENSGDPAGDRYSILIVDDMATNRMLVRTALNGMNYNILEAEGGQEALQLLTQHTLDVVLLDVNMPEMDGFEVCRKIREIEEMKLLPVIMLTSAEDTDSVVKGMQSGATDYLVKPFHPNELMARLTAAAERNRLSAELIIARRAAESANQTKSTFLATMSHEIRTPMNVIIGLSHICLQAKLQEKERNYIKKINNAAKSLLDVINDVLDFSRIEAGKLELSAVDFDIRECFARVDSLIGYMARDKGLYFEIVVPESIPYFLKGDVIRLGQILVNLAGNAVKFTEKGSVIITVVKKEIHEGAIELEFSVRDTGIGLSKKQISILFSPYNQADISISRKYGGSGLGLVISRELVELMKGKIWIDSEPGQGSVFHFTARFGYGNKIEANVTQQFARLETAKERLRNARILIVEDNPFNQLVIEDLLEMVGADTTTVSDGEKALECLSAEKYDLVLMDAQMPVMDGYETTRHIRAQPELTGQTIIAMTGNVTTEDRRRCLAVGMDDFIPKPIEPDSMYLTLAQWLSDIPLTPDVVRKDHKSTPVEKQSDPLPVDTTNLSQMFRNDAALIQKVSRIFIDVASQALLEMEVAQNNQNLPALGDLGHKLKSSARTIGAYSFADLCEKLERASLKNDWVRAQALLLEIPPSLEKVIQHLEQEIFIRNTAQESAE